MISSALLLVLDPTRVAAASFVLCLGVGARAQSTFDSVHPIYRARCAACHSQIGQGGFNIAAADIGLAYADSQLSSYYSPGQTKGFATLVRIKNGGMPLGAGCTGNPTVDAPNPACLTAGEIALLQAWIQDGQLAPLPTTGSTFCFGNGSGAACACPNAAAIDGGCANSLHTNGGKLTAAGTASLAADGLILRVSRVPDGFTLFFQGDAPAAGGAGIVLGDGLFCASGAIVRLVTRPNQANAVQYPQSSDPSLSSIGGIGAPGEVRHYQAWYRDAANFCTPATFNLTNGVSVTWSP